MNFTVFGATGAVGKELVKQALVAGHHVTAFARTPRNVPMNGHENLRIVQGDALNAEDVAQAISNNTDLVISVLGHRRDVKQEALLETSIQNIIDAMHAKHISRLIALSGAGAKLSDKDKPNVMSFLIGNLLKILAGDVLQDSLNMAARIMQTELDWTIPRAPRIIDGQHTGNYRIGYVGVNSGMTISNADIADFILKEAQTNQYLHDSPVISY